MEGVCSELSVHNLQALFNISLSILLQMTCGITIVDDALNRSFYKLGLVVGKYPGYFIIIPVLLTVICITGYQRLHYQIDPEYLFSPEKGEGKTERVIVEQFFKVNYTSRFNVARITRAGKFYKVFISQESRIVRPIQAQTSKPNPLELGSSLVPRSFIEFTYHLLPLSDF